MKISMIGCGYVGLVTGTCLANLGNDVICVDVDKARIEGLNKGVLPIFEPGLRDLVELNLREGRLRFTLDIKEAVQFSDIIFIAVGTPSAENGVADLSSVFSVAKDIAIHMNSYKVVVVKSTVPPGTCSRIKDMIASSQRRKMSFDVVSNPEFLREGEAVNDFMLPDRIVIGVDNDAAKKIMLDIYKPIERTGRPILVADMQSSELIKYASNAMLAARISFMNEISHLCRAVGADVKMVAKGIGLDNRIGPRFLQAGAGYGGSCFPKDVRALIHMMGESNCKARMMGSVDAVNEDQKLFVAEKVKALVGNDLKGRKIALWGLAFKPKTDDMRDAPSIVLVRELQKLGAVVSAFDPVARNNAKKFLNDVEYSSNSYDAARDSDCLVIITEWDEFRELDKARLKSLMKLPNIVDARNIYEPSDMRAFGFNYEGIGR
ncbi:UDP-glucose/GDP-mannose dehydrogenase family protein [Candidatus Woesearchaeota archaeon]|nr:UDP-glucose/GDP-mannose dehydrogenase family protein [Candidatus Woesearchaeota archaeon]